MPLPADDAFALLEKAHAQDRLGHAYLITGPEGSGKRRLATRLCALITGGPEEKALRHPDIHTVEPESKSRRIVIDQMRDLERELQMRSSQGGGKAGVIFDADRLQPQAANAFLKTLEEPPPKTHLLLLTALPDQLLETILSRCIEVSLQPGARREPTAHQRELLGLLKNIARRERVELPEAFGLVREFQRLLGEAKGAAQEQSAAELKAEEQRYKQIADARWFEEREDYFKALTEARYVAERSRLLETLEQWWADILRQCSGAEHLDVPDFSDVTAAIAQRLGAGEALRRSAALETLREQLGNSGIQEQLAIECAFLKAFCAA